MVHETDWLRNLALHRFSPPKTLGTMCNEVLSCRLAGLESTALSGDTSGLHMRQVTQVAAGWRHCLILTKVGEHMSIMSKGEFQCE